MRQGRQITNVYTVLSVCLDVKGRGLSSAVIDMADVEGLKYDCMLDCLASHIFVSYNSL